jgi:hypothetical protein
MVYASALRQRVICLPNGMQGQYWSRYEPYKYVPVTAFSEAFERSATGKAVAAHVSTPHDQTHDHPGLLATSKYSLPQQKILRACLSRELTLMSRNR